MQHNSPDKEANLTLALHLLPLLEVLSNDTVLKLYIRGQRLAGEQGQEGLANGLVRRPVHESQVALPEDVLARGVHGHQKGLGIVVAEHPAADCSVCGEDHELAAEAVPRETWEGVPAGNDNSVMPE